MKKPTEKRITLSIEEASDLGYQLWVRVRMTIMSKIIILAYIGGYNNAIDAITESVEVLKNAGFSHEASVKLVAGSEEEDEKEAEEEANRKDSDILITSLLGILIGKPHRKEERLFKRFIHEKGVEGFYEELEYLYLVERRIMDRWDDLIAGRGTTEEYMKKISDLFKDEDDEEGDDTKS